MAPKFHHLGDGGGHTAGGGVLACGSIVRTIDIIVRILSPRGRKQRGDGRVEGWDRGVVAEKQGPLLGYGVFIGVGLDRGGRGGVVSIEKDLLFIIVEPTFHMGGHGFCGKGAFGGIAQDGHHAVVGRNQHKAFALWGCEDIELGIGGAGCDVLKCTLFLADGFEEMVGHQVCLVGIDGLGLKECRHKQQEDQGDEGDFIFHE